MGILVDAVRVAGFRAIDRVEVGLSNMTVLIGMNNAGKTSLLKALQLALGDYSRYLGDEDFRVGANDVRAHEVLVDIRIVPVDDAGERTPKFEERWASQFGDCIRSEANGDQFVAIRTRSRASTLSAGFDTTRRSLDVWPEWESWPNAKVKESKCPRFSGLAFVAIDAQRDIHQDLRDKYSFVGRVLSSVEYNEADMEALEALIAEVNGAAVNKSDELKLLRRELDALSGSSLGSHVVELTPFPKKIRDLSKYFTLQTGSDSSSTFSMEYHGMGTRSWASILALKAFTELEYQKRDREAEPYSAIIVAEEPEAHLHPNAQRALYEQLEASRGQVLLSTHSPYLAAAADPVKLRHLRIGDDQAVEASSVSLEPGSEAYRKFCREVINSRGEILFAKALLLCEGETEEQALPELFEEYFGCKPFSAGICVVGVGGSGAKYTPFLTFARDFHMPVFVFSDGEAQVVAELKKAWRETFGLPGDVLPVNVTVLDGEDFEGYLVADGYADQVRDAICGLNERPDYVEHWIEKHDGEVHGKIVVGTCDECGQPIHEKALRDYSGDDGYALALTTILRRNKTMYAPALAAELRSLGASGLPRKIDGLFSSMKEVVS